MTAREILKTLPPKIAKAILIRIAAGKTELYYGLEDIDEDLFDKPHGLIHQMDWNEQIWCDLYHKMINADIKKQSQLSLAC